MPRYCNLMILLFILLKEKYKMMPFHGCYLSFHGFSDDEKKHMEESTEQQGQ